MYTAKSFGVINKSEVDVIINSYYDSIELPAAIVWGVSH